jgi:hypothetical protein
MCAARDFEGRDVVFVFAAAGVSDFGVDIFLASC